MRLALDRWRILNRETLNWPETSLHFVGSHDPAVTLITTRFDNFAPGHTFQLTFAGSLGGLIALARGECDLAGIHLWDEESDTFNTPFVRRLLPGQDVVLLTLAHRHLGLVVPPSNPANISNLTDLTLPGAHFVNRQSGAGTRIWLDAQLRRLKLGPEQISGYTEEAQTHSEVAKAIVEERANVGLAVEATALAYGLDFLALAKERYDFAIPGKVWERPPVRTLARWLATDEAKQNIEALGGYDVSETGRIAWVKS